MQSLPLWHADPAVSLTEGKVEILGFFGVLLKEEVPCQAALYRVTFTGLQVLR